MMPELKESRSRHRIAFAFRRQAMTNRSTHNGATANIAQATFANTIGRLGSLFLSGLQHVYTAHTEKVQMRFAPKPIHSGRIASRRRPFGL
jgi:hypothetical protein